MEDRQVRALLSVMNIGAPEGTQWCAWRPEMAGYLADEYKIRDHWRFYLVEEGSELQTRDTGHIVWGI